MWIFCCGMMRSGSTLQYQITAQLVEDAKKGHRISWHDPHEFPELREQYADSDEWLVLKSHAFTPEMGAEFSKGAKGIYIYRDIRDVLVSISRKQKLSAGKLIKNGYVQEQLSNYEHWTSKPNVLVSRYEDVMDDMANEVRRIANHLDIDVDDAYCQHLAKEYSIDKQKKRIDEAKEAGQIEEREIVSLDTHSLLHTDHIQDGRVNTWQEALSNYDVGKIEAIAGDWLKQHGYQLHLPAFFWRQIYKLRVKNII